MRTRMHPSAVERAKAQFELGWSLRRIASYLGVGAETVRSAIDPGFKAVLDKRREKYENRRRVERRAARSMQSRSQGDIALGEPVLKPHGAGGVPVRVPADVLADRDRRAAMEPASLAASLCGDPLPGRSALDQRQPKIAILQSNRSDT